MNALYGVGREKARYAVAIRPWRGLGTILNARIDMRPMTMRIMVTVTSMIVTVMAVFVFRPVWRALFYSSFHCYAFNNKLTC